MFFCLVFAMPLCASVYMCLVVTCWERADLFALVYGVVSNSWCVTFSLLSWVRYGTGLYRFLIFAPLPQYSAVKQKFNSIHIMYGNFRTIPCILCKIQRI